MAGYPCIQGSTEFIRDTEITGLEVRASRYERVQFGKHAHPGYSIGLILSGSSRVFLRGKQRHLGPGAIVLLHPDEVHACNPAPDAAWAYLMFHMDMDTLRNGLAGIMPCRDADPEFTKAAIDAPFVALALQRLHAAMRRQAPTLEREAVFLQALSSLAACHLAPAPGTRDAAESRTARLVREWLQEHWAQKVRLADLAHIAQRSEYAVLRAFRKETGFTPHGYQLHLRMARARSLLAKGVPVVEVALATGFADQSHFTQAFCVHAQTTPGRYRKGRG